MSNEFSNENNKFLKMQWSILLESFMKCYVGINKVLINQIERDYILGLNI